MLCWDCSCAVPCEFVDLFCYAMLAALCVHITGLAPESENNMFFFKYEEPLDQRRELSVTEDVDDESLWSYLTIMRNMNTTVILLLIAG